MISLSPIEVLLQQIELEDEIINEYCQIEQIEVDEISETWTFFFVFSQTIPILHYRNFISKIKKINEYIPSVRFVDYNVKFENIDPDLVLEYYDFCIDSLLEDNRRILPLKEYSTDIIDNVLKIFIPKGAVTATIFRKDIENEMKKNGFDYLVEIEVDHEQETIDQSIQNQINDFVEANKIEFSEEIEYVYLTNGGVINDFVSFDMIPRTEMELAEYREKHGGKANISIRSLRLSRV
jgi:DNA polymerase III alpha subunit (gram-positive type)